MQISILHLLATLAIYFAISAAPLAFVVRLWRLADHERAQPVAAIRAVGCIAALVLLSTAASLALLVVPAWPLNAAAQAYGASVSATGLASLCAAQAIWSMPSAGFHVLGPRLIGPRCSLRNIARCSTVLLLSLLALSFVDRSAESLHVGGLLAQVVTGFLPLSAVSNSTIVLSTDASVGLPRLEATALVPRTIGLCTVIGLGLLLWRRVSPA
jgi:hypothetical protein